MITLQTNIKKVYSPIIKSVLTKINGMHHTLFAAGMQLKNNYAELNK